MTTKIKLKLSRYEYETVNAIAAHVAGNIDVVDASSLYEKETMEDIAHRFASKKWRLQNNYNFSLSIAETVVFIKHVGTAMMQAGIYECTVYHTLYEQQIAPQTDRAVQMRMRF